MNKNISNKDKQLKATVFAEALKATDPEDFEACRKDMEQLAALDPKTAKIVAASIRAKQMPNLIKSAGLEGSFEEMMSPHKEDQNVSGFAKKKEMPESEEEEIEETPKAEEVMESEEGKDGFDLDKGNNDEDTDNEFEEKPTEDTKIDEIPNEDSEPIEDENEMKTITIEVPASKVDAILDVLYSQLPELVDADEEMGGEAIEEMPVKEEAFAPKPDFNSESEMSETPEVEGEMIEQEPKFDPRSENMEQNEKIAQRKAYRANLLERVADNRSEDIKPKDIGLGKDTSANGKAFQYSDKLQGNEGETEYPKMTLENSDGNSLKGDMEYSKIPIPTKNGDNLQLKDGYENFTFNGGDDGTLDFSVDFDELMKIPSAGETATDKKFEIPTQMDLPKQKTTIAKVTTCQGCDNPRLAAVDVVECADCGATVRLCSDCQDDEYCPSCAATAKKACNDSKCGCDDKKCEKEAEVEIPVSSEDAEDALNNTDKKIDVAKKEAEVFKARIKSAYEVATQLVFAKVIEPEEVQEQVETWMNDNVPVASMKKQASLWIRSVRNSAERVAATAAEKQNVRTAGVSINPTFVAGTRDNGQTSISELQSAISSFFMEPYNEA